MMNTKDKLSNHVDNKENSLYQDIFVEECFSFDLPLKVEKRNPSQIQGLKDIPGLVKKNRLKEAWQILDTHQDKYIDLDFIYVWQAMILERSGRIPEAKEILADGLKHATQKHVLCDRMGFLAYKADDMAGAIKWWIRSVVAMHKIQTVTMWEPFLYLAYVAQGFGNENAFQSLMVQVTKISVHGELQLEKDAQKNLNKMLKTLPLESVTNALDILCTRFEQDTSSALPQNKSDNEHETLEFKPTKKSYLQWLILMGLILTCLLGYLFFTKPTDITQKTATPQKTIQIEQPSIEINKAPVVIASKKEAIPNRTYSKKATVEYRTHLERIPHIKKQPGLKVKTKTTHPDIKKKPSLK